MPPTGSGRKSKEILERVAAGADAFALLQLGLQGDGLGRGPVLDLIDQKLDALERDLLAGLNDGGHDRDTVAGHRDPVKADDGDVLRHPEPGADQRPDGTKRDDIAHGKQGGKLGPACQQAVHGVVGGFKIVVGEAVEPVIKGEARLLHGILRAQAAHPAGKTGGGAAQHRDLAVPLCDEVSHGGMGLSLIHIYSAVVKAMEEKGYEILSDDLAMVPMTTTRLTDPDQLKLMGKLLDALEDNDDVQNVWHSLENEEDLPE